MASLLVLGHVGPRGHHHVVVHERADGLGVADLVLVGLQHRLELADGAHREAQHAEAVAGRHGVAGGVARRVPHGRMGLVERLGEDLAGRQGPVLTLVALVLVLHPHLGELPDDVLPDLPGVGQVAHLGQEAEDLVGARTPPRAELEAAVGEVVQHRHLLGHLGRVVHLRQRVEDARAQVDPIGGVGQVAHHHLVGRQVGVLVEEVVLGDPDVLEARLVRRDHALDVVHDRLVLRQRIVLAAVLGHVALDEDAEFHGPVPQGSSSVAARPGPPKPAPAKVGTSDRGGAGRRRGAVGEVVPG